MSFVFSLDLASGVPVYRQIIDKVTSGMATGSLKPGDQLPTVRSLASELRINFNTVSRAYRLLDEAGIISTQQGRGTYILEMPPPEIAERLRLESLDSLSRQYLEQVGRLGFSVEQAISHLSQQTNAIQAGSENIV